MAIQHEAQRSKRSGGIRIFLPKPGRAGVLGLQDFENFFARPGNFLACLAHSVQFCLHQVPGSIALRPTAARRVAWFYRWCCRGRRIAERRRAARHGGFCTQRGESTPHFFGARIRVRLQMSEKEWIGWVSSELDGLRGSGPARKCQNNCNDDGGTNAPMSGVHLVFSRPDLNSPQTVLEGELPGGHQPEAVQRTVGPQSGSMRETKIQAEVHLKHF